MQEKSIKSVSKEIFRMKIFFPILFLLISISTVEIKSQVIEIQPLFEYPIPPEEMESLEERCNYLVKNFWNDFDFKKKQPIDQYALNEAFKVYCTAFQFASVKEIDQSVDKLISKISSDPVYLLQFTKAAEFNLYSPNADFWIDSIYLKFLDALVKNKKISENRKEKYIAQAKALRESATGNTAPTFSFTDLNGESKNYFPMSTPTLLIFGDPENTDWRLERLRMDSNFKLGEAIDKGKINILYIAIPASGSAPLNEDWKNAVSNYNKKWTIGTSDEAQKVYDTRLNPSIFLVGSDGKILYKNISAPQAVSLILELIN